MKFKTLFAFIITVLLLFVFTLPLYACGDETIPPQSKEPNQNNESTQNEWIDVYSYTYAGASSYDYPRKSNIVVSYNEPFIISPAVFVELGNFVGSTNSVKPKTQFFYAQNKTIDFNYKAGDTVTYSVPTSNIYYKVQVAEIQINVPSIKIENNKLYFKEGDTIWETYYDERTANKYYTLDNKLKTLKVCITTGGWNGTSLRQEYYTFSFFI